MKPIDPWKKLRRDIVIRAMHLHDKTLALIEGRYVPLEICILNHETSQFVHRLNENSFKMAMGLTQEEFHTYEISVFKIALTEDKLAVYLEIVVEMSVSYQTQIWKLDTANPSNENIHYWTTIEHNITNRLQGGKYHDTQTELFIRLFFQTSKTNEYFSKWALFICLLTRFLLDAW